MQGGVEKHAEHLYTLLVQYGCKVEVLARAPYIPREQKSWNGVIFRRLWAPRIRGVEAFLHSVLGILYAVIRRPDILHIHAVGPAIVAPIGRVFGLRIIVTHHGPDYDREKWGIIARLLLQLGERWGMRFANQRIVISNVIKQLVFDKYQLDSVVIPNGITLPELPASNRALVRFSLSSGRYVLLVSRIVPEKRHLDLIEAFSQSGLWGWRLVLVGEIDHRDKYCAQVLRSAEKNPEVVITDYQSGTSLHELYANAGIFVLPSSHEGLPIALLEALSYGLPVLASDIPANLEIGLPKDRYFPVGDVEMLAKAIYKHASRKLDGEARDEVRRWVISRYDWKKVASATYQVYQDY